MIKLKKLRRFYIESNTVTNSENYNNSQRCVCIYIMYLKSMMDTSKDKIRTDTFCNVYLLYLLLWFEHFLLFLFVSIGCAAVVRQCT